MQISLIDSCISTKYWTLFYQEKEKRYQVLIMNNICNQLNVILEVMKDWVTLVTVSQWYDDMFQNWWFWYDQLNLGMKVIVIAEDSFILGKYSNHSSISLMYFGVEQVSYVIIIAYVIVIVIVYVIVILMSSLLG